MPQRRCVGCGRIAAKSELIRIAALGERGTPQRQAVRDVKGTMPGRGAYLCRAENGESPMADCLAHALRRGGISRALRSTVTLDPKLVESVSP